MMKNTPNRYVITNALIHCSGAFVTGYLVGSFNGVLEMAGFKEHFTNLYATNETYEAFIEDNQTLLDWRVNDSSSFCDVPSTTRSSTTCGFGKGTGSASFIGLIVATSSLGSVFGSLVGGWISDWISRKFSHMLSLALVFIGAMITASAYNNHAWMLIFGRLISGFAIGSFYVVMPVYLSEISPKESRGTIVSLIGPLYTVGIVVSICLSIGFAEFYLGWRVSIGVAAIIALVSLIGSKYLPHSPRWLVKKRRDQEALFILLKINHDARKETFVKTYLELEGLKESITEQKWTQIKNEFCKWKYTYRLFLMMVLFFLYAWVAPFISYYSTSFFCEVNVSPFFGALAVGVVFLVSSLITIILIDKIGRKMMFLSFLSLNFVTVLAVAFLTQFCASSSAVAYFIVILLCLHAFGFSSSWLTLPWVINGEVFPVVVRGLAAGVASSFFWFFISGATLMTPIILTSPLRTYGLMYITAGLNLFGFFFIFLLIPETKGVCLEDMDKFFSQQKHCGTHCRWTSSTCDSSSFKHDAEDNNPQDRKPSLKINEKNHDILSKV